MPKLRRAVLVDVDGTLCDVGSIRHLVTGRKNYDAFHYLSLFCPPIEWVAEYVRLLERAGLWVVVVTAREDKWRLLTLNWLNGNGIPFGEMHMRKSGDFRSDSIVKEEILLELMTRLEIVEALDDNPSVIGVWERFGIRVITVPGWGEIKEEME